MSSILKAFVLDGITWDVRIVHDTNGKPWFCANDVGHILGMTNIHASTRDMNDTEKVLKVFYSLGGPQNMTCLSKKAVFKVLMRSNKPVAKVFQEWVWQVLEEIEETGRYELKRSMEEEASAMNEQLKNMENALVEERRKAEEAAARARHSTMLGEFDGVEGVYIGIMEPIASTDPQYSDGKYLVKIGSADNISARVKQHVEQYNNWTLIKAWKCGEYRQFESFLDDSVSSMKFKGISSAGLRHNEVFVMNMDEVNDLICKANRNIHRYRRFCQEELEIEKMRLEVQRLQLQLQLSDIVKSNVSSEEESTYNTIASNEIIYKSRTVTRGPKIQRYTPEGNTLLKTYNCYLDATRDAQLVENAPTTTGIKEAIKGKTIFKGFRWAALDRNLADETLQDIGDTVQSQTINHGIVAALNLARTRIECVFVDQKDAAEKLQLKGLGSVSIALKKSTKPIPRMTRGFYLRYWRDCSEELRTEFLNRGGVLPEERVQFNAMMVIATHVTSNVEKRFSSVSAAQKTLHVSRTTIFDCVRHGYALPSGYRLRIEGN